MTDAQAVLADGPVACWRLDETTGTIAHDSSGHDVNVAYGGGHTLGVAGLSTSDGDLAVELDGSTGMLQGTDVFDFASASAFSAEGWVKLDAYPETDAEYGIAIKRATDRNGDQGWALTQPQILAHIAAAE